MKKYFILLFFLSIGFVPYLGSIDKIGSQWLYISILNFFLIFFNFKKLDSKFFKALFSFKPILFYSLFIFFCSISLLYSNNITISIVDLSRILITAISIINLIFFFSQDKFAFKPFAILISLILFSEVCYSFYPLFEFLLSNDLNSIDFSSVPNALKGLSGNKNVMSSNIVFKLPFVIYLIFHTKSFYRYLFSFIFLLASLDIYLLSSRASFISTILVLFISLIYFIYNYNNFGLKSFIPFIISISLIAFFISFTSNIDSISLQNRVNSISASDTSTNHRLVLYENAIDYIYNNPFIGCGIGNWKVESLPYWKSKLTGYTIPYHAHNDFLEVSAEIGFIGGVCYFLIFLSIFYASVVLIRKNSFKGVLVLSLLIVYFIDAFLNFPLERALSQVNFMILILLTYFFNIKNEKLSH